ncbi:hypothetical protein [Nocardioides sp.]|uniref:hypothetical protein n=1 Tax=Nocardioides sp. TaxID=35761 RepID=UPI0035663C1C
MNRFRYVVAVGLTAGLVLTGGAAQAASKSVKDKAKDAPAAADITRVTVKNDADKLAIKVKLRKARAGRTHLVATLSPTVEGAPTYVVRTVDAENKGKGKKIGATLEMWAADADEAEVVECKGIKAAISSGRNGQSQVRVPQACFGDDAGTLVVEVATVDPEGEVVDDARPLRVKKAKG